MEGAGNEEGKKWRVPVMRRVKIEGAGNEEGQRWRVPAMRKVCCREYRI